MKIPNKTNIKQKTPHFLFYKEIIRSQYDKVEDLCDKVIYPVKTNPHKKIIKILDSKGSGFLVSSIQELKKIDPKKALLTLRSLDKNQIKKSFDSGVKNFIIESERNLIETKGLINKKVNMLIRFNPKTKLNSPYGKEQVFGFDEKNTINHAINLHKKTNLGIHIHLTTQLTKERKWKSKLKIIHVLLKKLHKNNIKINFLDIGGGLPVQYTKKIISFEKIKSLLNNYFKKYKELFPNLKIFIEPGRFIVGPSGFLITQVKELRKNIAVVNSSVYSALMDTLIAKLECPCYSTSEEKIKKNYMIKGKSTCSLDVFRKKVKLNKLSIEDYIIFFNAGAYIFGSNFVDDEKIPCHFV